MNRKINLCLLALLLIQLIPCGVSANESISEPFPTFNKTISLTPWNPQTDEFMRYWTSGEDLQHLNPMGFIYSFVYVYSQFFGEMLIIIFYCMWAFLVWNRSHGAELIVLGAIATAGTIGLIMPTYFTPFLLIIIALGMSAILFRLMKSRK